MNKVPFVDLKAQYLSLQEDIDMAISAVINKTNFIGGNQVKEFEEDYAKRYGVKHCIGVGNGTDAIYITLKMLGIGDGDEVITVANSWISTSETISQCGAKPVFVDIEPDFYTIDIDKIEERITENTKAIIPVHLYGQMADVEAISKICKKHNLYLIEDCAQAHFAELNKVKAGTTGIAGTFSFYPGKNLGAYGDAGAVITNDDDLASKIKMYANHGALVKHQHEMEGINSRLDTIHAAVLSVKLPHIQSWNKSRLDNALKYNEALRGVSSIELPKIREKAKHVFHLYVLRVKERDGLRKYLGDRSVQTGIHYPTALPLLPAYSYLEYTAKDFPVASKYQNSIISLPMFPELNDEQIADIAGHVKDFYS